ncbi:MAG: antibiotic biosynthesis monooxygenase [Bacteroidetes bacterium]|nr:antibiotic biosynthesis monooxygenase [Bacteroidota bacterium]
MIVRIVQLTIAPSQTEAFTTLYLASMERIQSSAGCLELTLLRDVTDPNCVTTLSKWTDLEALEAYRHSEFFRSTWAEAKQMFSEKAKAFSYSIVSKTN